MTEAEKRGGGRGADSWGDGIGRNEGVGSVRGKGGVVLFDVIAMPLFGRGAFIFCLSQSFGHCPRNPSRRSTVPTPKKRHDQRWAFNAFSPHIVAFLRFPNSVVLENV